MAGCAQACEESDISEGWVVACPCGASADDGERMLECERCQTWQHAACVGAAAAAAPVFLCTRCAPSPAGAQGPAAAGTPATEAGGAAAREAAATPSAASGGPPASDSADGARDAADGPAEAACALEAAPRQAQAEAAADAAAGGGAAAAHARPAKRCASAEDAAGKVGSRTVPSDGHMTALAVGCAGHAPHSTSVCALCAPSYHLVRARKHVEQRAQPAACKALAMS
jgi:hypothetical protein